jgi:hypothetical protein
VQSGEITDLRKTYFEKIALPAMREVNSAWQPKIKKRAINQTFLLTLVKF